MSVDDFLIVTPYCLTSGGSCAWAVWTLFWMSTAAMSCENPTSKVATMFETPLLVLHSEQDLRCAIEQGEHLFTLLRLLGKEVEMVRFPAESHELSRSGSPIHRVTRFETILEYFGRYLSPGV